MSELREALFAPESVAIVGQSNDLSKTAGRPLKYLRQLHSIVPGKRPCRAGYPVDSLPLQAGGRSRGPFAAQPLDQLVMSRRKLRERLWLRRHRLQL